jgi:1,2-diacylglycerol 3-beta-galactosyltransferase
LAARPLEVDKSGESNPEQKSFSQYKQASRVDYRLDWTGELANMRQLSREVQPLPENISVPAKIVEIFYFDAGGGHRNAMNALSHLIAERHPDWRVIPVDLQQLLEPIDPVYRLTRRVTGSLKRLLLPIAPNIALEPWQAQDIYNNALKRGATRGLGAILPILQGFIRRFSAEIETLLAKRWKNSEAPDLVVSVIPNFNRVMFGALRQIHADVPYITVMTDMVDCPPHFWMEDQDQIIVAGTDKALEQARKTGFYQPENIFSASGMILRQSFYDEASAESVTRARLGLDPNRPTALIMFGGNGSQRATVTILDQFEKSGMAIQTIVMCGKNKTLYESLKDRPFCHPVGFVANVADYMRLADFFIGKPGPGSISEAIHMGCPVIVEKNKSTMPQESPNPDWVRQHGLGIVVKSFKKDIATAAAHILEDIAIYQANIRGMPENRAVFEVVGILEQVVERGGDVALGASEPNLKFLTQEPRTFQTKSPGHIDSL